MADRLEGYVLMAKGMRGRAAAEIVQKATADPYVLAFSELLDLKSVQEVQLRLCAMHPVP